MPAITEAPIFNGQVDSLREGMRLKDTHVTLDMARDAILARFGKEAGEEVLEKQVLKLYKPEGFPDYLRGVVLVGELPVQVTAKRVQIEQLGINWIFLNIIYPEHIHRVSVNLNKKPFFLTELNEDLEAIRLGHISNITENPTIIENPAPIQVRAPFPHREELGPHDCLVSQSIVIFPSPQAETDLENKSFTGDSEIILPPAHVYITSLTSAI